MAKANSGEIAEMAVEVARTTVQTRVVAAKKQERVFACPSYVPRVWIREQLSRFPPLDFWEKEREKVVYTRVYRGE